MPDYFAILTLYRIQAIAAVSGTADTSRDDAAAQALGRVAEGFLTTAERANWDSLSPIARNARLRLGRKRLQRWEMANPDIAAVLRRRARAQSGE